MLSIQDVGLSVFSDSPKSLYILGGSEYGIKAKYIDILVSKVGPKLEYSSVADVLKLMSTFHIVPLKSQVYVVRYDKSFVSALDKDLASKLLHAQIIGTLVLLYEDSKEITKLNKWFPDNTAVIDPIDPKHMIKYLTVDFPSLDKKAIAQVAKYAKNYYQAQNICRSMDCIKEKQLLTERQMLSLFDIKLTYTNADVQVAIASKNFNAFAYIVDHYEGDLNTLFYQILWVMTELEKCKSSKYVNSPLKQYAKAWTVTDIYFMFNHVYEALKSLRSGYTGDIADILTYLGSLFMFKSVPDPKVLK